MANKWTALPLGDLCLKITDGAHSSPPSVQLGKPMASVKDLTRFGVNLKEARQISESDFALLVKQGCQPEVGDVLIAKDGNSALDTTCLVKEPLDAVLLSSVAILRPNPEKLVPEFLKQHLSCPRTIDYLKSEFISGAAIPRVILKDFRRAIVNVPPLEEQRAIAHILGTLDDKIELNRKQNETLEAMARTLFKAWFVDFEPVRAKMEGRWQRGQSRPGLPAHLYDLFPDRLVESELGEIPEGWEVSALGDFVEAVKGRSYKSEELAESTTALVTLKSFARGGGYRTDGLKSFTGKYKQEQIIEPGDVVIACTDVTQAAEIIGRAAIVRGTRRYETLVASLDTMIVRPRAERVTRAFLYHLGRSDSFVAHTYSHTTGTTVLHLGKEAIPTYLFVVPPQDLVRHFDVTASSALVRIDSLEDESERLAAIRDTLLPKLISGELRVPDAERIVGAVV